MASFCKTKQNDCRPGIAPTPVATDVRRRNRSSSAAIRLSVNLPMQSSNEVDRDLRARQPLRSKSMIFESSVSLFKRVSFSCLRPSRPEVAFHLAAPAIVQLQFPTGFIRSNSVGFGRIQSDQTGLAAHFRAHFLGLPPPLIFLLLPSDF